MREVEIQQDRDKRLHMRAPLAQRAAKMVCVVIRGRIWSDYELDLK